MTTTVLLADDNEMVRTAIGDIINRDPDLDVVASVDDGELALEAAALLEPDVVIMDLSMPRMSGVEATRRLFGSGYSGEVLMLAGRSDRDRVADALRHGAVGYLLKDDDPESFSQSLSMAILSCSSRGSS